MVLLPVITVIITTAHTKCKCNIFWKFFRPLPIPSDCNLCISKMRVGIDIIFFQLRKMRWKFLPFKKSIFLSAKVVTFCIFLFRFLCEYIYYISLTHSSSPVLFIHVPVLSQTIAVNDIAKTITEIICCCLQQLWITILFLFKLSKEPRTAIQLNQAKEGQFLITQTHTRRKM